MMASSAEADKPLTFNPSAVRLPPPTFQHVAITPLVPTSKLITLAGQVGSNPATGDLPESFVEQVKSAYVNVANCLKASGASPRDIIHVRHYFVQDTGNAQVDDKELIDRGWGPLWMDFMDREANGHRPPDTVLGVASLAKKALLYEVEVWAVVHG